MAGPSSARNARKLAGVGPDDGRVGDQDGGIGARGEDGLVVGEGLDEIPQLAQTRTHGSGKGLVLEQEPQRRGGVGSSRHGPTERLVRGERSEQRHLVDLVVDLAARDRARRCRPGRPGPGT